MLPSRPSPNDSAHTYDDDSMGGCQHYGSLFGDPNIIRHPLFRAPQEGSFNFDNHPYSILL